MDDTQSQSRRLCTCGEGCISRGQRRPYRKVAVAQQATTAAHRLEVCITDVQRWMEANRLKLNADKTQILWAAGLDMV